MNFLSFLFKKKKPKTDLECLPDAVMIISENGEILDRNEKALKLFPDINLDTCELLDLFDGGFNLVCDLVNTGAAAVVRSKIKLNDELYLEVKAAGYDLDEKTIIASVRDVSSTQKMLNKLIFEHEYLNKLTKEKNTFIAKISNELTSPLHSVNGFSQAVLEGLGGEINEKQEKYLKIINKNSASLLNLIEKLVDYSKLESGTYDYEFKNFDFVSLMIGVFNEFKPIAEEKGLVLNIDLNGIARRNCWNDENILKKILENLVDSAIKTTESGSIKLTVTCPDKEFLEIAGFEVSEGMDDKSYLMFQISDTSTGLIENEKDTIFNPYADVEKAISRKNLQRNLSMGLVYNLVKLLKGKIWVESETLKGKAFTFIIPSEKAGV